MRHAWRLAVLLLAMLTASIQPAAAVDDSVKHTIRCPLTLSFVADWSNKISSDPTLTIHGDDDKKHYTAHLSNMFYFSQRVTCGYSFGNGAVKAQYSYVIERHVIKCGSASGGHMQCELKP